MARIPFPFKRATAAFDEVARARLCTSSGSEHSGAGDSSSAEAELSDLVNSFIEKDGDDEQEEVDRESDIYNASTVCSSSSGNELLLLQRLLGYEEDNDAKAMIRYHIDLEFRHTTNSPSQQGFKHELMNRLRDKGLDAGLCKTRWKKTGQFPSGDYEYIDVMLNGNRYIVETNLPGEFMIARPTKHYQSLLDAFPAIFVGEADDLNQVAKLMCNAMKRSIKNCDMYLPPWRRNAYMSAKWFGSYQRTTRAATNVVDVRASFANNRSMGVAFTPASLQKCSVQVGGHANMRKGQLAQVFGGINL